MSPEVVEIVVADPLRRGGPRASPCAGSVTWSRGRPIRQVFFCGGEVVIEVVGPLEPDPDVGAEPARFFGLAITVEDLDATAHLLDGHMGSVKEAVQAGRRIATLRNTGLGISTAVAFMSRDPGRRV
ncbi:MAG: hypothetical protein M5T61_11675 [Acidimicrobiia bacterium]|nr:hypothetical protein [Acidimicrobiia bacterium]